jgi:hypothetical protein
MGMALTTKVFYGYIWPRGEDPDASADTYESVGEDGLLEWQRYGLLDNYSGALLAISGTLTQKWDGDAVPVPSPFPSAQVEWDRVIREYLISIGVELPTDDGPHWYAVGSYS